ncbi:MAG: oxidoreductase [Chloroflexi bacterium HGW-Chloroflexi-8]|nr:MAG: oxidoreductase [Chloroflexi bacterium HGW-Chloroflexi-8]
MATAIVFTRPLQVDFESYDVSPMSANEVHIRTLYSGISAGTEMTQYRGTSPFLSKQWDVNNRLFLPAENASISYPVRNLGYEESGVVIAVGSEVKDIKPGQHVFGTWGHRTDFITNADYVRDHLLPPDLDPICGIFSHIGAIALNGVHDGRIRLGETVAVFGLGVLGQIVCQAVRASGAKVIGIDFHESRLALAKKFGANFTFNAEKVHPAETIKALTGGKGADVCLEVSGSTAALNEAIRSAAYSARVVAMGFFQGEAKQLYLGEEFHHNRINVVCSQISGTDPELKYRWDKMRLWQTAIQLQAEGVLHLKDLITHQVPFQKSPEMFQLLDQNPQDVMQSVIEFPSI